MRTFLDAKAMAKSLRSALGESQVSLSHSECLELVAKQFALDNWNVLSAKIDAAQPAADTAGGQKLEVAIPILRIFSVEKAKDTSTSSASRSTGSTGSATTSRSMRRFPAWA